MDQGKHRPGRESRGGGTFPQAGERRRRALGARCGAAHGGQQEGASMALAEVNHWRRALHDRGRRDLRRRADGRDPRRGRRRWRLAGRGGAAAVRGRVEQFGIGFGHGIGFGCCQAARGGEGAREQGAPAALRPAGGLGGGHQRRRAQPHVAVVQAAGLVRRRAVEPGGDQADQGQRTRLHEHGPDAGRRGQHLGVPHRGAGPGRPQGTGQRQDAELHEPHRQPGAAHERPERGRRRRRPSGPSPSAPWRPGATSRGRPATR